MYSVDEMKTLVNTIEWEQNKREINKKDMTKSELELTENMSNYDSDYLNKARMNINRYMETNY